MTQKSNQFKKRNEAVRDYVNSKAKRYPHWKMSKIISDASKQYFLAKRTIEAIVKHEGIYGG